MFSFMGHALLSNSKLLPLANLDSIQYLIFIYYYSNYMLSSLALRNVARFQLNIYKYI